MKTVSLKLFLVCLLFVLNKINAQVILVANYTFSSTVATYSAITGGTILGSSSNDDDLFANLPIGFTFTFCGVSHTQVSVCSNGYLKFGGNINNLAYNPVSDASTDDSLVSAMGQDLQSNSAGAMQYKTIGTSPNQIFVVQFEDYTSFGNSDNMNFQIRLHQTSNMIEIYYGTFIVNANTYNEVGLRGNLGNGDFNNRSVVNSTNSWSASVAGSTSTDFCELDPVPWQPDDGLRYVWSPPCTAPSMSIAASQPTICVGSSVTFTASGAPTYTWSNASNATSITVTPSVSTTYTLKGSSATGCTTQITCTVGVVQGPIISLNAQPTASFCPGMSGTLVAAGATNGYTWNPGNQQFAIILISPSTNVTYTIVGANTQGCTTTTLLSIYMTTCTNIYDPNIAKEAVRIFPNPSNGLFVAELANGSEKQIEVMDVTGRIVLNKTSIEDKTDLNITDLSNGVYYIRLRSNNETQVFKIIKE